MKITFYGAASNDIDKKYLQATERLGEVMAERGHSLVFGGGCTGLMGAVVRGVKRGGGSALGVIPKFFRELRYEVLFNECDEYIWTDDMYERKKLLEELCDGFIIGPGGMGTYDEFFGVLTTKQLNRHNKPIAVFNVNGIFDDFIRLFETSVDEGFIKPVCRDLFRVFKNTNGLFEYLESENSTINKTRYK